MSSSFLRGIAARRRQPGHPVVPQAFSELRIASTELFAEGNQIALLDPVDTPPHIGEDRYGQPSAQLRSQSQDLKMPLAQPRVQVLAGDLGYGQTQVLGQLRGERHIIDMAGILAASQGETDGRFARVL